MTKVSITSLEKSARVFARNLRQDGYTVGVGVYRSGNWGGCENSPAEPSSVKLWIRRNGRLAEVTFLAGGWPGTRNNEFGGDKWSVMKAGAMEHVNKYLPETRRGVIKYTLGGGAGNRQQITLDIPIIKGCADQSFCWRAIRKEDPHALIFNFNIHWVN